MCGQLDNFSVLLTEHFGAIFFSNPIIPQNRILKCFQLPLVFTVKTVVMFCWSWKEIQQYNSELQLLNFSLGNISPSHSPPQARPDQQDGFLLPSAGSLPAGLQPPDAVPGVQLPGASLAPSPRTGQGRLQVQCRDI